VGDQTTETMKLYGHLSRYVDNLPESARGSARTKLDGLEAMTASTNAAYACATETARAQAARQPAAEATLKVAMQTKIFGMMPMTAVLGAVAVGGIAVAAIKFTQHRHEIATRVKWTDRIAQERADAGYRGREI
jgi:hypothetical protein